MFGSTANRLALPGSDIDVLICVPNVTCSFTYNLVYEIVLHILIGSKEFDEIEPIKTSQVPIISARHIESGVSLDMVIDREDGLQGLCLVNSLENTFSELRPLYLVIKAFLCNKNLHKPWKGGMGSFVLINFITCFLQKEYKKRVKENQEPLPLHALVIYFLDFLGNIFRHKKAGLSIIHGGFAFNRFDDMLRVGDSFGVSTPMLMSPLCLSDDLGTSLRMFGQIIKPIFSKAALSLGKYSADNEIYKSFVEILLPEARAFRKV
jgi:DNA polymerase sigma